MKELKSRISNLNEEIDNITEGTNKSLRLITENINDVLEDPGNIPFDSHKRLKETLINSIGEFEVSHPKISVAMSAVIESLNELGI